MLADPPVDVEPRGAAAQELNNPQHHYLRPELYTRWRQHIMLDFSRAIGLDATAARSFAELRCARESPAVRG